MSKKLIDEIKVELDVLHSRIPEFLSTLKYLDNAKEVVETSVEKLNESDENFNLKISELKQTFTNLIRFESSLNNLIKEIEIIDFPKRLDKIDTNLSDTIKNITEIKDQTILEIKNTAKVLASIDFDSNFNEIKKSQIETNDKIKNLKNELIGLDIPIKIKASEVEFTNSLSKSQSDVIKMLESNKETILEDTKTNLITISNSILKYSEDVLAAQRTTDEKLNKLEAAVIENQTQNETNNKTAKIRFYIGVGIFIICWILLMLK